MATLANLKARVHHNLYGGEVTGHPYTTILGAAVADGTTTTITVPDGTQWAAGDVLEIEETEELCLVRSVATNNLTVIRGYHDTTAAAAADAGEIHKNPRWTYSDVGQALTDTMLSLESWGIHSFGTGSVTRVTNQQFYELSETDIVEQFGVLNLYYVEDNTLIPVPLPFRQLYANLGTGHASYSQGRGIHVLDWGELNVGEAAYYSYAKRLDSATDLTTAQEVITVLGATALLMGMTIAPATQDPGARTDRTIQPGQTSRDSRWFQGEFFIRARAEAAYLAVHRQRYPGTVKYNRARRWRA